MSQFICLVEKAEKENANLDRTSFITEFRKIYYGDGVSDSSGKGNILTRLFGKDLWDLVIPDRKSYPVLVIKDAEAKKWLSRDHQEIKGPAGEAIDIGHALVGIDSCSFPKTALPFRFGFGLKNGPGVSTWAGDVGSAVADWVVKNKKKGTLQSVYNSAASVADMNGNADAYALYGLLVARSERLSKVLTMYYGGGASSLCAKKRWQAFFAVAGIPLTNNRLVNTASITESIRKNAKALSVQSGSGIGGKVSSFFRPPYTDGDIAAAVSIMVRDANNALSRETPNPTEFRANTCAHFD